MSSRIVKNVGSQDPLIVYNRNSGIIKYLKRCLAHIGGLVLQSVRRQRAHRVHALHWHLMGSLVIGGYSWNVNVNVKKKKRTLCFSASTAQAQVGSSSQGEEETRARFASKTQASQEG